MLQLENEELKVTVSAVGAQLKSIVKDGTEYLWQGDPAYWKERAPILFPYVGRLTQGKYRLGDRAYEMTIHGFARRQNFSVQERETDRLVLSLTDNEETRESYPWRFRLTVAYRLEKNRLAIRFLVENRDERRMYFGIGGHPGWNVPLTPQLKFSDYYLAFGRKCAPDRVLLTPSCFDSGERKRFLLEDDHILRLEHSLFDEDAVVLQNAADQVTLKSDRDHRSVTVSFPRLPYLGIWHAPKSEAPYVAIEPWTSLPSRQDVIEDISQKSDLIRLDAGEKYINEWSVSFT